MTTVVVKNKEELKAALQGTATEIIVDDAKLATQLRTIRRLRKAGPLVIGGVIASIALIPVTGGTSAAAGVAALSGAATAGVAGTSVGAFSGFGLAGLCVAIGGTVVIGMLTDWDQVEIFGVVKLKRKARKS